MVPATTAGVDEWVHPVDGPWAQASIAFAVAGLLALLGPDAYAIWGWRALFVVGALLSLGMFVYYSKHVTDAPVFHRPGRREARERAGVRDVLLGRWAGAFWQVFTMMSGLWLLTNSTVLLLTERLGTDAGFATGDVSVIIGTASVAQALVMALAGHMSTRTGRRALFVGWGAVAGLAGPLVWWLAIAATGVHQALILAAVLQVITVSAYGPVSAYLSERFPTEVRSTGYGMGYSMSLILPALFPFYLPWLEAAVGRQTSVMVLIVLGGALVITGALRGPRLSPDEIDGDIDEVAGTVVVMEKEHVG